MRDNQRLKGESHKRFKPSTSFASCDKESFSHDLVVFGVPAVLAYVSPSLASLPAGVASVLALLMLNAVASSFTAAGVPTVDGIPTAGFLPLASATFSKSLQTRIGISL
jgi:hypothetical protein